MIMIVSLLGLEMRINLASITKQWIKDFVETGTVEVKGYERKRQFLDQLAMFSYIAIRIYSSINQSNYR